MRNEKGMFLISSFLMISMFGTLSLALFLKSTTVYRTTERARNRITAFHLAESGVDRAIFQLRTDSNYTGQVYTALGNGGYDVAVTTPDPVNNPTVRSIMANGHTPSNLVTSYAYERRQVLAYVSLSNSPFNNAIFAKKEIEMSGNTITDSYNSRTGAVGTNGDIGTNGTQAGAISLSGNVQVKGDAVAGPGANVSTAITTAQNSVIQGTKSVASTAAVLDPIVVPPTLNNSGPLSVSGNNTLTEPGGTYWFSSISITGNGKVNFTGPAIVYVTGPVSIGGNGVGTAQSLPPNLLIYVQGTPNVSVSGNGNLYGAIYAPDAEIKISGNGAVFGAVVGNEVEDSGNSRIRFDEALKNLSNAGSSNKVQMKSWQES